MVKTTIQLIMDNEYNVLKVSATYKEWQEMGCQVLKGQKAIKYKEGIPLFEIWQTIPLFSVQELEEGKDWDCGLRLEGVEDSMSILDEEQWH